MQKLLQDTKPDDEDDDENSNTKKSNKLLQKLLMEEEEDEEDGADATANHAVRISCGLHCYQLSMGLQSTYS